MDSLKHLLLLIAFFTLNFRVNGSSAAMIYDLDSLSYKSSQIIEGKIIGKDIANNLYVWKIQILKSYQGNLTNGQIVSVLHLDWYGKWEGEKDEWGFKHCKGLDSGDELFLFLKRADGGDIYQYDGVSEFYAIVLSGLRLVVGEKVADISADYSLTTFGVATNMVVPNRVMFRQQIFESIQRVNTWRPLLEKPTERDIPALLKLIHDRKVSQDPWVWDAIAIAACQNLVSMHNASALTNAITNYGVGSPQFRMLSGGITNSPLR